MRKASTFTLIELLITVAAYDSHMTAVASATALADLTLTAPDTGSATSRYNKDGDYTAR